MAFYTSFVTIDLSMGRKYVITLIGMNMTEYNRVRTHIKEAVSIFVMTQPFGISKMSVGII